MGLYEIVVDDLLMRKQVTLPENLIKFANYKFSGELNDFYVYTKGNKYFWFEKESNRLLLNGEYRLTMITPKSISIDYWLNKQW